VVTKAEVEKFRRVKGGWGTYRSQAHEHEHEQPIGSPQQYAHFRLG
jgi:hypothetical protein